MDQEQSLLRAIFDSPDDPQLRLAYADWLEERGDARAEFIRAVHRLREMRPDSPEYAEAVRQREILRGAIEREWLQTLGYWKQRDQWARVLNCELQLELRCPNDWNRLQPTEDEDARFCTECQRQVQLCLRDGDVDALAKVGLRVASVLHGRPRHHGPHVDIDLFVRAEDHLESERFSLDDVAVWERYRLALNDRLYGEALELLVQLGERLDSTNPFWRALEPLALQAWPIETMVDRRERGRCQARIDLIRRRARGYR